MNIGAEILNMQVRTLALGHTFLVYKKPVVKDLSNLFIFDPGLGNVSVRYQIDKALIGP